MPVVILIIALGGALVVFSIILIIVIREVKKDSGRVRNSTLPQREGRHAHICAFVECML